MLRNIAKRETIPNRQVLSDFDYLTTHVIRMCLQSELETGSSRNEMCIFYALPVSALKWMVGGHNPYQGGSLRIYHIISLVSVCE